MRQVLPEELPWVIGFQKVVLHIFFNLLIYFWQAYPENMFF